MRLLCGADLSEHDVAAAGNRPGVDATPRRRRKATLTGWGRNCQGNVFGSKTGPGDRKLRTYGDGKP